MNTIIPPLPSDAKPIPNYPTYCVKADGTIWSCHNNKWGYSETWKHIKPGTNSKYGRQVVALKGQDGKLHSHHVHRLILLAFVGPCPDGMEACHKYGDMSDNRLDHLRWDTPESNYADMRKHGKMKGERHHAAILTDDLVREIRARAANGETQQSIADSLNMQRRNIGKVVEGIRWGHVI